MINVNNYIICFSSCTCIIIVVVELSIHILLVLPSWLLVQLNLNTLNWMAISPVDWHRLPNITWRRRHRAESTRLLSIFWLIRMQIAIFLSILVYPLVNLRLRPHVLHSILLLNWCRSPLQHVLLRLPLLPKLTRCAYKNSKPNHSNHNSDRVANPLAELTFTLTIARIVRGVGRVTSWTPIWWIWSWTAASSWLCVGLGYECQNDDKHFIYYY